MQNAFDNLFENPGRVETSRRHRSLPSGFHQSEIFRTFSLFDINESGGITPLFRVQHSDDKLDENRFLARVTNDAMRLKCLPAATVDDDLGLTPPSEIEEEYLSVKQQYQERTEVGHCRNRLAMTGYPFHDWRVPLSMIFRLPRVQRRLLLTRKA
ncbi:hypothetical protein ACUN9V_18510 [Salinicola sp. V024]|uniref:hypothetical protein n=1 Tax=Salinicola sp. V024 TaxID=3459609 RepID=UPI004044141A